jgi:hypothetical protein
MVLLENPNKSPLSCIASYVKILDSFLFTNTPEKYQKTKTQKCIVFCIVTKFNGWFKKKNWRDIDREKKNISQTISNSQAL